MQSAEEVGIFRLEAGFMTPEQWQNIKRVLAGALEKSPEDRRTYLDETCPDPDLRREVESLIAAHEQGSSDFMEPPTKASPLQPGTRLGPYEIVSRIGRGGMGVVYRAHDSKLRRDVAIKVLPPAFVNAPDRLARFQREARLLASLNHPNIAAIHGLEDSGGTHALVMELVEGPTLGDRIAHGPIPIDEALPIAKQIAEGLEYAHEHGIVHRDLKPANIKVTADGTVKILDFGLAKAMETGLSPDDMGDSPTLSRMATEEGVLLGTAAYMSPEQAKAKPVDRRADVWAFGCVLFEMLAGELAFPGESVTETLAAVLKNEPDWSQLPKGTPPHLRVLLYRCLQKDPKQRLRDIGDARLALDELLSGVAPQIVETASTALPPLWRRALPWAAAGAFALVALAVALFSFRRVPSTPAPSIRHFGINMGKLNLVVTVPGSHIMISPDGRKIVFLATGSDSQIPQLYLRSIDNMAITPLRGTQGAGQPFFSPDSQWVGFSADGKLEKVPLAGGLPVTLCDAPGWNAGVPATWVDNGSIFFITRAGKVDRVPAGGGTPQPVGGADPGKLPYRWIASLPGSRGLLLVATNGLTEFDIDVLSLETGKSTRQIDGGSWPRYLPTGQIIYAQYSSSADSPGFTGGLLAVPFDLKRLAVTGSPVPVLEGVTTYFGGAGFYDVAVDGTLVYFPSSGATMNRRLAWFDSNGVHALPTPPGSYNNLSISPDGKHVALTKTTGLSQDIYIYNVARNAMQRLTFEGANDRAIFTSDGTHVIYDSTGASGRVRNLWMRAADGSGNAERLTTSKFLQWTGSVSPDGKLLAYTQIDNLKTGFDIYVMPLEGNGKPRAFLRTPSNESLPVFSPDGKWIAYMSDESGKFQVFVQAFPGPGGKHQISSGGGVTPVWSRDGKKIYYNVGNSLMKVDVTTRPTFSAGTPRLVAANLSVSGSWRNFDVAPDGRILLAQSVQRSQQSQQGSSPLQIILNFATEVQNRLAAAKQ